MLGGSFWIALLRNAISAGLMLSFFLMLDRPRCSMKKTIWIYLVFGVLLIACYSLWYLLANASFVKLAAFSTLPAIGSFCSLMSNDGIYLSLYKIALAFYLFSVSAFLGVDVARWWFGGNLLVDLLVRVTFLALALGFTWFKFRRKFLDSVDFLIEEMDLFSAVTLFVSVMFGAIMAYWPNLQGFSIFNMVRAFLILFMAGMLQYAILHLYIHLGLEHYYQAEKELLEVNEQLLHSQMDLMRESAEEVRRMHHDVRHHILLMKEYVQKQEYSGLLDYLEQYSGDVENQQWNHICKNYAVSSILSAYARKAESQGIQVEMNVRVAEDLAIRDIDWVAILANVFENALHGCLGASVSTPVIYIYIAQKRNKVMIQCRNTSAGEVHFEKGLPCSQTGGGLGVLSIIKAAARYEGETDFSMENGQFVTRILLNLPVGAGSSGH